MTENVEARRQIERSRETGRELVDELAQIALELVFLAETEEFERRDEGVGDRGGVAVARHGHRGRPESDGKQPRALRAVDERQQQRGGGAQTLGQFGHLSIGVSHKRGSLPREGLRHELVFRRTGYPWVRDKLLEPETRRGLHDAAARIELEQQRAGTVGRIERVLMQMWQHVGETGRPREERHDGLAGRDGCRRHRRNGVLQAAWAYDEFVCFGASRTDYRPLAAERAGILIGRIVTRTIRDRHCRARGTGTRHIPTNKQITNSLTTITV